MDELHNVSEGLTSSLGTMAYLFRVIIIAVLFLELIIRLATLLRIFIHGLVMLLNIFVLWPAWILL